jgi:hypothetical protein
MPGNFRDDPARSVLEERPDLRLQATSFMLILSSCPRSIGVGHADLPVIGITNMDRRVVVPDVYRRVLHLSLCLPSVLPVAPS